jgi:hypothetical protein
MAECVYYVIFSIRGKDDTTMSAPQESGLASIIGSLPEVLTEWESFKAHPVSSPAQWHIKFWGRIMADEQKLGDAQLPEGSGLGNEGRDGDEIMDVDMSEGVNLDDDVIPGCHFLNIDIEKFAYPKIWIRAEYIRIYDALEAYYNKPSYPPTAPAAVITGQPGIGEF